MQLRLTRSVKVLLILSVAVFVIQQTMDMYLGFGGRVLELFALTPRLFVQGHWFWQVFTYPFLHAEVMHLFLNMLMLVFIGSDLEAAWGTARFLKFYFFCTTCAGLLYVILQAFFWGPDGGLVPMVGSSGGIYGLLMAYGLIFGERVLLFMMLFPMKAKHFIWILAGIEFMSTVFSGRGGLASAAHLGGMAAGFAYLWVWASISMMKKRRATTIASSRGRGKAKRRANSPHLTLIKNVDRDLESDDDADNPKTWH